MSQQILSRDCDGRKWRSIVFEEIFRRTAKDYMVSGLVSKTIDPTIIRNSQRSPTVPAADEILPRIRVRLNPTLSRIFIITLTSSLFFFHSTYYN